MKRILLFLYLSVLCISVAAYIIQQAKKAECYSDENQWVVWTKYFDAAFVRRPEDPEFWRSGDSYHTASLTKFVFGAFLYTRDQNYAVKRDKFTENDLDCNTRRDGVFVNFILPLRNITAALTVVSLISVFVIMAALTQNSIIPAITVLSLIGNDLFVTTMVRTTWDSFYIVFLCVAAALYVRSLLSRTNTYVMALSYASAALAVVSKMTGFLYYLIFVVFTFLSLLFRLTTWRRAFWHCLLFLSISIALWISYVTLLLHAPLTDIPRFIQAESAILHNQTFRRQDRMRSFSQKTKVAYCLIMQHSCLDPSLSELKNANSTPFPAVNIMLFLIGASYCIWKAGIRKDIVYLYFSTFCGVSVVFLLEMIAVGWLRYYALMVLSVVMIQSVGVWFLCFRLPSLLFRRRKIPGAR